MANMHKWYAVESAIPAKDCDQLLQMHSGEFNQATIENNKGEDEVRAIARKSKTAWLDRNDLFARTVWSYVLEINKLECFEFNLSGYEKLQITRYEKGEHYDWHTDNYWKLDDHGTQRKLSAIVQLSKPEDYQGGKLEFFNGIHPPEEIPLFEKQGSIIVFPAGEWHRITEVTEGVRHSLVFWGTGHKLI